MGLLFGTIAMITAILNIVWTIRRRDAKWFRFISLSFTVFTLCAFYALANQWVLAEASDMLMDVLPTLSKVLWFLAIVSVTINSISLFNKQEK